MSMPALPVLVRKRESERVFRQSSKKKLKLVNTRVKSIIPDLHSLEEKKNEDY